MNPKFTANDFLKPSLIRLHCRCSSRCLTLLLFSFYLTTSYYNFFLCSVSLLFVISYFIKSWFSNFFLILFRRLDFSIMFLPFYYYCSFCFFLLHSSLFRFSIEVNKTHHLSPLSDKLLNSVLLLFQRAPTRQRF